MSRTFDSSRLTFDRSTTIKTLFSLAVMAIFWVLPAVPPLTDVGMRTVGAFLGTVLLLSLVDMTWPSILCMPLFALTGVMSLKDAIIGSFGSWITMFVIMSFVLTYALNDTGFTARMTAYYMSRRFVSRSPWVFTAALVFLGMLVGWFLDPVPTTAFFMGFSGKIFRELGYDPKDRYPHMVTMALAFAINIGGAMTPISHPLAILGMNIYAQATGKAISLFTYMAYGFPIGLIMLAAMLVLLRLFFRPDMERFKDFDVRRVLDEIKPMGLRERITILTFFAVVVLWILPGIGALVAPTSPFIHYLNALSPAFPPMMAVVVLAVLHVDDRPVVDLKTAFSSGMSWGVIFLVGAAILLGGAVTHKGVGLSEIVSLHIKPLLANCPEMAVVVAIVAITSVITNFTSNVTTIVLMTGVALSLGTDVVNPAAIALATTFTGACAYMVPASFASIGVLYGDEFSHGPTTFKWGALMVIVTTVFVSFLGYPLAKALL